MGSAVRGESVLGALHGALARLRAMESSTQLIEAATADVCRVFGFDRSVMFRVSGSELVGVSVHIPRDAAWAQALLETTDRVHLPLKHMLFETEVLRQRRGMILHDALDSPRGFRPLIEAFQTRAYVAAPIMPSGRVIGFLHADHHYSGRDPDEHDREVLSLYAEAFGFAFERTVLLERLRLQRDHVQRLLSSAGSAMDGACEAGVDLVPIDDALPTPAFTHGLPGLPAAAATPGASRLDSLLTRRELEVLALMADGQTNAGIATRLVISEGTVKSHVGHVLRKMRAANRAEAVSRYLRLAHQGAMR